MWPILFFLKKLLLCDVSHIEFFTRKIFNFLVEWICPDGIIPDSGLSGLNNIYMNIYFLKYPVSFIFVSNLYFTFLFFYFLTPLFYLLNTDCNSTLATLRRERSM